LELTVDYVFSSGGGVQSTACLVLAAQGKIPYRTFIFSNVGNKAESPATIRYIDEVAKPYAQKHGIKWVDVAWVDRQGRQRDLYDDLMEQQRSINIPVFMPGGMPGNRKCTEAFKIKPIAKWIKNNAPGCTLGKGISTDEPHRATPSRETDGYSSAYPLIELGISRSDCLIIAKDAGLPQPPKSSCWFCPFKTTDQWVTMRRERNELFEEAVKLERALQDRRQELGKDPVYLSSIGGRKELDLVDVIPEQLGLFGWEEEEGCESGYCMT
jgi:3'-phosphoadenosine 5'-phosphosulfate sulfotransferase (PAPS reductase)/FAD synthetase